MLAVHPLLIGASFDRPSAVTDEIVEAINDVAVVYPQVRGVSVSSRPLGRGIYAYTSGRMIVFNSNYSAYPELFDAMVDSDIDQKFHPGRGHCSDAALVAIHEAAHVIDVAKGQLPRLMMVLSYGDGAGLPLSGYSFTEYGIAPGEALAEAFASVKCNGGNPTEQAIAALLD